MERKRGTWNSVWRVDADCCFQQRFEHEGVSCGSDVMLLQEFVMTSCCALTAASTVDTAPVSAERVMAVSAETGQ
jgi:hypothetical protein